MTFDPKSSLRNKPKNWYSEILKILALIIIQKSCPRDELNKIIEQIKILTNRFNDLSVDIIEYFVTNKSFLYDILIASQESTAHAFKNLILNVITISYKTNLELIESQENGSVSKLIELLDYLLSLIPHSKTWLKTVNYPELLESLSENEMILPYLI